MPELSFQHRFGDDAVAGHDQDIAVSFTLLLHLFLHPHLYPLPRSGRGIMVFLLVFRLVFPFVFLLVFTWFCFSDIKFHIPCFERIIFTLNADFVRFLFNSRCNTDLSVLTGVSNATSNVFPFSSVFILLINSTTSGFIFVFHIPASFCTSVMFILPPYYLTALTLTLPSPALRERNFLLQYSSPPTCVEFSIPYSSPLAGERIKVRGVFVLVFIFWCCC